jgi:hypothetical protein
MHRIPLRRDFFYAKIEKYDVLYRLNRDLTQTLQRPKKEKYV